MNLVDGTVDVALAGEIIGQQDMDPEENAWYRYDLWWDLEPTQP